MSTLKKEWRNDDLIQCRCSSCIVVNLGTCTQEVALKLDNLVEKKDCDGWVFLEIVEYTIECSKVKSMFKKPSFSNIDRI